MVDLYELSIIRFLHGRKGVQCLMASTTTTKQRPCKTLSFSLGETEEREAATTPPAYQAPSVFVSRPPERQNTASSVSANSESANFNDLFRIYRNTNGGKPKENLARWLSSKIVSEARDQADACRGQSQLAADALRHGIIILREHDDGESDYWRLAQAELLGDLGAFDEAKLVKAATVKSIKVTSTSTLEASKDAEATRDAEFHELRRHYKLARRYSQLSVFSDNWAQTPSAELTTHGATSSYFDVKTRPKFDRFEKIRHLLEFGSFAEDTASNTEPGWERQQHLLLALQVYQYGCHAIDLRNRISDYDHSDCANLFFSAARICIQFDLDPLLNEAGEQLEPRNVDLDPPMTERIWKQQAWQFIEQGKSRALLTSIVRGEELAPRRYKKLLNQFYGAIRTVHRTVRQYRRSTLASPTSSIRSRLDTTRTRSNDSSGGSNSSTDDVLILSHPGTKPIIPPLLPRKILPTEPLPLLNTTDLEDVVMEEVATTPLEAISPKNDLQPDQRRRAKTNWSRAYLFARASLNPVSHEAAVAALPESRSVQDLEKIQSSISEDTLVVEYGLASSTPTCLITLLIDSTGVRKALWQKDIDVDKIKNQIEELRSNLNSKYLTREVLQYGSPLLPNDARVEQLRRSLLDILVDPILDHLEKTRNLIIIPSGDLVHVPWAMLFELPLSIAPSISIWSHLHNNHGGPVKGSPNVSIVSNAPKDGDELRDIPYCRFEALEIAQMHDALPQLADDLDWDSFRDFAKPAQVLHLCAHGTFDGEAPMQSQIQLFKTPVTLSQWHELTLEADLVVFSSCLSALSKNYDSGSSFGFAHTLLASGTLSFIGSLWSVDDDATLLFMMMFYQELRKPLSPVQALHATQRRMKNMNEEDLWGLIARLHSLVDRLKSTADVFLNNPPFYLRKLEQNMERLVAQLRHPRSWAAFTLTGYGFREVYPREQCGS